MELLAARQIVEQLYPDVKGVAIARAEQERLNIGYRYLGVFMPAPTITYGEIPPEVLHEFLTIAAPREGEVFYDLGSGIGQTVFQAALTFDFSRLVGVELLDGLALAARGALERYDARWRGTLPPAKQAQVLEFRIGNLLDVDVGEIDVLYSFNACLARDIMTQLAAKLEGLRSGARVIAVGQPIAAACLECVRSEIRPMPWGEAQGYLYRRV